MCTVPVRPLLALVFIPVFRLYPQRRSGRVGITDDRWYGICHLQLVDYTSEAAADNFHNT